MASRVRWQGLAELQAALRSLPEQFAGEAAHEVEAAANSAAFDIRSAYGAHRYSGKLQDSVKVNQRPGKFGAKATVKTTAKHAHLFEFGTQARHTTLGVSRGSMPPGNIFLPRIIKARRQMQARLIAMLERAGLRVRGDAG